MLSLSLSELASLALPGDLLMKLLAARVSSLVFWRVSLAAKMLSMDLGGRAEEADGLWNGTSGMRQRFQLEDSGVLQGDSLGSSVSMP